MIRRLVGLLTVVLLAGGIWAARSAHAGSDSYGTCRLQGRSGATVTAWWVEQPAGAAAGQDWGPFSSYAAASATAARLGRSVSIFSDQECAR